MAIEGSSSGSCSWFPWFKVYRVGSKAMPGITIIGDAIVVSWSDLKVNTSSMKI